MSVEFTDNTAKIKAALSEGVIGFLHEAGGEIQAQTQRNSRVDTGQTKGSYKYIQQLQESGTDMKEVGIVIAMKVCGILIKNISKARNEICKFFANCMEWDNGTAVANLKLVTDTGVLAGELAPAMDEELGKIFDKEGRR